MAFVLMEKVLSHTKSSGHYGRELALFPSPQLMDHCRLLQPPPPQIFIDLGNKESPYKLSHILYSGLPCTTYPRTRDSPGRPWRITSGMAGTQLSSSFMQKLLKNLMGMKKDFSVHHLACICKFSKFKMHTSLAAWDTHPPLAKPKIFCQEVP